MEPIATYSEIRIDGARTFTLFKDRIVVKGKQIFHSDFEFEIRLTTLDPHYDRIRARNGICIVGICISLISFITYMILVTGLKMSFAEFAPCIVLCIGVGTLILSVATYRKVEFFRFRNQAGLLVLDIARSGKKAEDFDSFVGTFVKQIEDKTIK